jgi:hypothetical protein
MEFFFSGEKVLAGHGGSFGNLRYLGSRDGAYHGVKPSWQNFKKAGRPYFKK